MISQFHLLFKHVEGLTGKKKTVEKKTQLHCRHGIWLMVANKLCIKNVQNMNCISFCFVTRLVYSSVQNASCKHFADVL